MFPGVPASSKPLASVPPQFASVLTQKRCLTKEAFRIKLLNIHELNWKSAGFGSEVSKLDF